VTDVLEGCGGEGLILQYLVDGNDELISTVRCTCTDSSGKKPSRSKTYASGANARCDCSDPKKPKVIC
jgi:hypothetical protein